MAFCEKCGNQMEGKVCPSCGNKTKDFNVNDAVNSLNELNNTSDYTEEFDRTDIESNKVMAVLSYLWILFLVPLLGAPNSKYARFHANQGLVLFICDILFGIVIGILSSIPLIGWIAGIFSIIPLIFVILGIYNAATGKAKELPLIGKIRLIK